MATDWCSELKNSDLARWGLLDQVARERCIDRLLSNRPLPAPELLLQMRQELEQKLGLLDPERRSQWLQQHGLSEEELDRMAARTWQWLMWCRERWGSGLETIFLRRKAEFDRVSYSMLRLPGDGGWVAVDPGDLDPGKGAAGSDAIALLMGQLLERFERPRTVS